MKIKVIYLDMDGVLADFEGHFRSLVKHNFGEKLDGKEFEAKYGIDAFWKLVWSDKDFFANLDQFHHARELYLLCRKIAPTVILSSPPSMNRDAAIEQKKEWLKKYLGTVPSIFESKKEMYANHETLLIDDFKKNIKAFSEAGGQTHRFTNFNETKEFLNSLNNKD